MAIKECLICLLIVVALGYGEAYNSGGCTPNMVSIYWCVVSKLRWLNSEERCSWNAMRIQGNFRRREGEKSSDLASSDPSIL
ncbi:hypothetical protein LSH36_481g03065 [Paralvinella palmiformis]|uniref:Uncharacterized protein n=1 Tax=Paralvinella palmiformis TaxID=53620 RepID=A0AAD9J959_9ANNE|nr:hypothetical protein LSH36_481g03065 [Paralvinella palmiformis]